MSILINGSFTQGATALSQTIVVPSNLDYLWVYNLTQANGTSGNGFRFYWQRGFSVSGDTTIGIVEKSGALGAVTVAQTASQAFVLYDPSAAPLGNPVAVTSSTNATQPVIATGSTAGLVAGVSVVVLSGMTAVPDINGPEFIIDTIVANTSFRIQNALANAPGAVGGAGFYRVVNFNPLFYPRRRYVAKITQSATPTVTTTIPHGFTVGQELRFNIPSTSGMIQLNPTQANNFLSAIVTSVTDANNFVININTSSFTAFTWPTAAQMPTSFPLVVPIGEDTPTSLSSNSAQLPVDVFGNQIYNTNSGYLADATVNTGFLGMTLAAGAALPAGSASDQVYWSAGKVDMGGL